MKKLFCFLVFALMVNNAFAGCGSVPDRATFKAAAETAAAETASFGFANDMWATMVDETGRVCYIIAVSTENPGTQVKGKNVSRKAWLLGRVASAQKAATANSFSTNTLAMSSGFLYYATVPNGFLYGMQFANPVHPGKAYGGDPLKYGTGQDHLVGKIVGGLSINGGGVALYKGGGVKVGAIGAAGDTTCRDHMFAYRMRIALGLKEAPTDDGLTLVAGDPAGFSEHPQCGGGEEGATNGTYDTGNNTHNGSDFGIRNLP